MFIFVANSLYNHVLFLLSIHNFLQGEWNAPIGCFPFSLPYGELFVETVLADTFLILYVPSLLKRAAKSSAKWQKMAKNARTTKKMQEKFGGIK